MDSPHSVPLPSLEESLAEISKLIDEMENKDLTLEQSLAHFERGISLVRHCQKALSTAEQKVKLLVQQNDQETLVDYEDNDLTTGNDHEDKV